MVTGPWLMILGHVVLTYALLSLPQPKGISAVLTSVFFDSDSSGPHLGLKSSLTWSTFFSNLTYLGLDDPDAMYKLVILGRHGEGFHNVAEAKYGSEEWDDYWSRQNCDEDMCWGPDANLTQTGELQAEVRHQSWLLEQREGLLMPGKFYSSPLSRALRTAEVTFALNSDRHAKLSVLEDLREIIGVHTCDERSSRAELSARFPFARFSKRFSDRDLLWSPTIRETDKQVQKRAVRVLQQIFDHECRRKEAYNKQRSSPVISITSHSGLIRSLLAVLQHAPVQLPTGGAIPLVVAVTCSA